MSTEWLTQSYVEFDDVEEAFHTELAQSLDPQGPDALYDLVASLGLPPNAFALDVGCGKGEHALELARRFGLRVLGIDPVETQLPVDEPLVRFERGVAEELPVDNGSADLIWCRDMLVHAADIHRVYAEFVRVLRGAGRAVVYQMFVTDRLEAAEASWFLPTMGIVPASASIPNAEAAIAAAGLRVDECVVIGSQWGERAEEETGKPGKRLLWAARLLREPERYVTRFGQANYEIMLGDCLWHVYAMIGKLERRAYVLTKP
jgi:SAM-dependent methyltransferase